MKIGLLVNPTAGRQRAARYHMGLAGVLRRAGHLVVDLSGPDAESARVNARRHLAGLDAVIVMGGDGAVQLGLNVVATSGVPLGIVPVGSGNDNATGLGLPTHPTEALDLILTQLREAPEGVPTDAIRVTTTSGTQWAMAILNCGFDATVNELANNLEYPKGSLRYVRAVIQSLPDYRAARYTVKADTWEWEGEGLLVGVANNGYMGGGMHLTPDGLPDDGLLDVCIVNGGIGKLEFLTIFPRVFAGTHVTHRAVDIRQTRRIEISADQDHVVYADGEYLGRLPLTAEVIPDAVRIFRGPTPLPRSERRRARRRGADDAATGEGGTVDE
ncbi:MAG TPA: diacylglycerol kinase family lipid kinase, partial [Actinomycetales bacterium]|nr:diacylglycerol kinase family lipid kinase [Actinomycetales bacterium]